MNPLALHKWQYADYPEFHGNTANLWVHLIAVPVFILGNVSLVLGAAFFTLDALNGDPSYFWPLIAVIGTILSGVSMSIQGRGHGTEPQAPKPFTSAGNAIARIFVEQWVTFPRFVLSGGWLRALRAARSDRT